MSRHLGWVWPVLVLALLAGFIPVRAQTDTPLVMVLTIDDAVAPSMVEYLERGLGWADQQGAELVILQLNTPGGSIDSMNEIIQLIRNSRVPVVVYVAPSGAMAGSAGTVVVLAGHAAAMAPDTAIGAASPVGSQGEDLGQTMQAKVKNILKATVRSLAEGRGSWAVELAEQTIDKAAAASADEALAAGLVDFVAVDIPDLLRQLDGFKVKINAGQQTLITKDARLETVSESFIERLLAVLTNSAIVFLLLSIGVQAILIELSSPGGWVAGFIGVVCLALAAYGLGVLPVNWFGVIFLIVAFVLFILDIKAPTHGALTVAGTVSLIVGALVMFNSPNVPSFQRVPVPLIIGASVSTGIIFFVIMLIGVRAQKTPVSMGVESLVGRVGVARIDLAPHGQVQLGGELWTADLIDGEESLSAGARVEVVGVDGLRLLVRKAPSQIDQGMHTTAYRYPHEHLILTFTLLLVLVVIGLTATATVCASVVFIIAFLALSYNFSLSHHNALLREAHRVTPQSMPDLAQVLQRGLARLQPGALEAYVVPDDELNAYTFGLSSPKTVVLYAALFQVMDEDEILFILGHELGHVALGHTWLNSLVSGMAGIPASFSAAIILNAAFLWWNRACEYSADRAGLLACGKPEKAISALVKLGAGRLGRSGYNLEEVYRRLDAEDDQISGDLNEILATHPLLIHRIQELKKFAVSEPYRRLKARLDAGQ